MTIYDVQATLAEHDQRLTTIERALGIATPEPEPPSPSPVPPAAGQVFRPRELAELPSNPGFGWQTFHQTAGEDRHEPVASRSCYDRLNWSALEPQLGVYSLDLLRNRLAAAKQAGQLFATRVMTWNNDAGPAAYQALPGWWTNYGGARRWQPDLNDARVRGAVTNLVVNLATVLNDPSRVDLIDIGHRGPWGEFSEENRINLPAVSLDTFKWLVDLYVGTFTRIKVLVGAFWPLDALEYAFSKGCGWGGDSWGDFNWNHPQLYDRIVARFPQVWKQAPVRMEPAGTMNGWGGASVVGRALDFARASHVAYLQNKLSAVPSGSLGAVQAALRQIGYRLVVREVAVDADWRTVRVSLTNAGTLPVYVERDLCIGLERGGQFQTIRGGGVGGMQPGEVRDVTIPLGAGAAGQTLLVGVLNNRAEADVALAIEGRQPNGLHVVASG
ncbi:MAG: hypothetical protein AB7U73_18450 [Pirellulales bacterium]